MEAPITRPSNVRSRPLAGRYRFRPTPGIAPVEVDLTYVLGQCTLIFPDGTEKLAKDTVPGWPAWQSHLDRIA